MQKLIDLVDLSNWKKQKDILLELYTKYSINITSREWRSQVKKWNKKWRYQEVPYYITHSSQLGFKATTDFKEAKIGRNDYVSRLKANKDNILDCDEGFQRYYNCKIDFETGEIE